MKKSLIVVSCLLLPSISFAANQTYQDTVNGKSCKESSNQQIDCVYKIGKDLHIYIAGIGLPDTSISFYASDYDGDYFARVGILHGCIIVVPGQSSKRPLMGNHAFISPKNGKVYEDWRTCKNGY